MSQTWLIVVLAVLGALIIFGICLGVSIMVNMSKNKSCFPPKPKTNADEQNAAESAADKNNTAKQSESESENSATS